MTIIAHKRCFTLGILVAIATGLLDQASKFWLIGMLDGQPPLDLIPFFDLVLVWNHGISFGMFAGAGLPVILIAVSVIITAILLAWLGRTPSRYLACALGLVIGGALGNVVDRLRFGAVADFFDAHIGGWHWPAFNIADSAIFIGVVLLCVHSMFIEQHHSQDRVT